MNIHDVFGQSAQFLDILVSCIQHSIIISDPAGRIRYANPVVTDMFGRLPEELANQDLSVLFTPEDMDFLYPNLLHMAGKGEPFEGEIAFLRKDQTRFLAFVMFKPVPQGTEGTSLVLVSVRNKDGREENNGAFNRNHFKDLVKLADGIAHEMRNPIVGIGGFARRLRNSHGPDDSGTHYEGIMDNLRRLEGLVEKVELFARLPKPCLRLISPKELVEKAVTPYVQQTQSRGIRISADLEEASLFLDRALLSRTVSILTENAIDAVAGGGEIRIRGTLEGNEYRIVTEDTGCGISPRDLPHIFDPFYRTKPGGVGIDLTVVKRVVESQGGDVDVASQMGKGTRFTLRFPVERRRSVRTCRFEK